MNSALLYRLTACWLGLGVLTCANVAADSTLVARVVKMTPTLVYLDVGVESGIAVGDRFLIGRKESAGNPFAKLAQVQVLRSFEKFLIAEIESDSLGRPIKLLDVAIRLAEWDTVHQKPTLLIALDEDLALEDSAATSNTDHRPNLSKLKRFGWTLLGGYQHQKGGDIRPKLRRAEATADAVGARVFELRISWRIQQPMHMIIAYQAAAVQLEDEVFGMIRSQHRSVHCAVQYFIGAYTATRPYVSIGLGVHDLSFRGPLVTVDKSRRLGSDLAVGLEHLFGSGWKILGETSYQGVRRGNDPATSSNYRLTIGIGYGASI